MADTTDNDGRFPDGLAVLTPYPLTGEQAGRADWPWVAASIVHQVGPDEWSVVIEDERATTIEDGAGENDRMYPIVFRDSSEIRLPSPDVEDMRAIFPSGENDHHITPKAGSARQLDGSPAGLTNPRHYPAVAECLECGRPVRCERFMFADWSHLPDVTP